MKAPWSIPGPPLARARRSARTCTWSGGVGIGGVLEPLQIADHHRRQLLHRRTFGSGGRRDCRRRFGDLDGRLHRPVDQRFTTGNRRSDFTAHSGWLGSGIGQPPVGRWQIQPVLRGDREEVGRETRGKVGINELLRGILSSRQNVCGLSAKSCRARALSATCLRTTDILARLKSAGPIYTGVRKLTKNFGANSTLEQTKGRCIAAGFVTTCRVNQNVT